MVTGSRRELIEEFYETLTKKYKTKRLGKPQKYLGWHFNYSDNRDIVMNQP